MWRKEAASLLIGMMYPPIDPISWLPVTSIRNRRLGSFNHQLKNLEFCQPYEGWTGVVSQGSQPESRSRRETFGASLLCSTFTQQKLLMATTAISSSHGLKALRSVTA